MNIGITPSVSVYKANESLEDIQDDWGDFLRDSKADALFLSWAWQSSWWTAFADERVRCKLIWLRDSKLRPLALLPCYSCRSVLKGLWPIDRLQIIGATFRGSRGARQAIRSEHLGVVVKAGVDISEIIENLVQESCNLGWHEFVLQDLDVDQEVNRRLISGFANEGMFVRVAERNKSYSISLPTKFEDYLSQLSGSARRRVYNKRSILEGLGEIDIVDMAREDWSDAIKILNDLHTLRWGNPAYSQPQIGFHKELRDKLGSNKVELSCLMLNGKPISALHNITVGGVVYNLQSGFDSSVDVRISPMQLHLGMAIEAAINDGHHRFHLLAGSGMHTDFKNELATDKHNLVDMQIIRDRVLATAYKAYDKLARTRTRYEDFSSFDIT